jgi:hypothetical protein
MRMRMGRQKTGRGLAQGRGGRVIGGVVWCDVPDYLTVSN